MNHPTNVMRSLAARLNRMPDGFWFAGFHGDRARVQRIAFDYVLQVRVANTNTGVNEWYAIDIATANAIINAPTSE